MTDTQFALKPGKHLLATGLKATRLRLGSGSNRYWILWRWLQTITPATATLGRGRRA